MAKSDTGRKRVTLTDVARAAGVSKSTVSLVLNDSSLIKKETQQKVQQAIEQLGYVYNRFAANLRSQKSLTIGVVIDDLINPFFAEFTMGLEMTLAEHGFITVMSNTSQRSDRQKQVLDTLLEHHVAGIVLCPVNSTSEADLQRYANSSTHLINHDASSAIGNNCPSITLAWTATQVYGKRRNIVIQQGHKISCLLVVLRTICVIRDTLRR